MNLEDIRSGKITTPPRQNSAPGSSKKKTPQIKHRPSLLENNLFKTIPETPSESEDSKLNEKYSAVATLRTRKSLEAIVEELIRVLTKGGIKHKKLKDKYIFKCSAGTSEGLSVRLEVEIVNVNKSGDRALNFKRTGGDVWAYKEVYEF